MHYSRRHPGRVHRPGGVGGRSSSPGDALADALRSGDDVGILGIELDSRRRNRVNVRIAEGGAGDFFPSVDQSLGNCLPLAPAYADDRTPETPNEGFVYPSGNPGTRMDLLNAFQPDTGMSGSRRKQSRTFLLEILGDASYEDGVRDMALEFLQYTPWDRDTAEAVRRATR